MVHSGTFGRLAAHSETRVVLRRWVRKGVLGWHVPKEAFGLAFGTSVVLRRVPKGMFRRAFGWLPGHVSYSEGLRRGCSGVARPEGVFERIFERVFKRRLRRGSSGRVLRAGFRKGFRRGFREGLLEGFRRASERLSSGAALVIGLKIYGPGGPASSDWPNGQAVLGRPIGDQRRHVSGLSLLPGVSERVD